MQYLQKLILKVNYREDKLMEFKISLDIVSLKKALRLWNRKRSIISIIVDSLVILYGITIIVVSQFDKDFPAYLGIILLLLGLSGLIIWLVRLNKAIDLAVKQMQQRFDGDSCDYLFGFYEDVITNKNLRSGNTISIKYSDFNKCIESKDIILLITNLKQFIFIPKSNIDVIEYGIIINLIKDKNIVYKTIK